MRGKRLAGFLPFQVIEPVVLLTHLRTLQALAQEPPREPMWPEFLTSHSPPGFEARWGRVAAVTRPLGRALLSRLAPSLTGGALIWFFVTQAVSLRAR